MGLNCQQILGGAVQYKNKVHALYYHPIFSQYLSPNILFQNARKRKLDFIFLCKHKFEFVSNTQIICVIISVTFLCVGL